MKRISSSSSNNGDSSHETHQKKICFEKHPGWKVGSNDQSPNARGSQNGLLHVKQEHIVSHDRQEYHQVRQVNDIYKERTILRIDNVPFSVDEEDIRAYFGDIKIPIENGIHIIGGGIAFVEFRSLEDARGAMQLSEVKMLYGSKVNVHVSWAAEVQEEMCRVQHQHSKHAPSFDPLMQPAIKQQMNHKPSYDALVAPVDKSQAFSVPQSFPRDNHYNSSFDGSYLRGTSFAGATTIPRSSSYFISANHSSHGAPSGFGTARNQYDSLGHVSPPFLYPPPSVGPQFPTGIQQQEQHHHLSNSTPFFYAQLSVSPHRMKAPYDPSFHGAKQLQRQSLSSVNSAQHSVSRRRPLPKQQPGPRQGKSRRKKLKESERFKLSEGEHGCILKLIPSDWQDSETVLAVARCLQLQPKHCRIFTDTYHQVMSAVLVFDSESEVQQAIERFRSFPGRPNQVATADGKVQSVMQMIIAEVFDEEKRAREKAGETASANCSSKQVDAHCLPTDRLGKSAVAAEKVMNGERDLAKAVSSEIPADVDGEKASAASSWSAAQPCTAATEMRSNE